MAYIEYPFWVKHNGVDYKPHTPIKVDDVAYYTANGAVEVDPPAVPETVETASDAKRKTKKAAR